jgi:hypothetical protein
LGELVKGGHDGRVRGIAVCSEVERGSFAQEGLRFVINLVVYAEDSEGATGAIACPVAPGGVSDREYLFVDLEAGFHGEGEEGGLEV